MSVVTPELLPKGLGLGGRGQWMAQQQGDVFCSLHFFFFFFFFLKIFTIFFRRGPRAHASWRRRRDPPPPPGPTVRPARGALGTVRPAPPHPGLEAGRGGSSLHFLLNHKIVTGRISTLLIFIFSTEPATVLST